MTKKSIRYINWETDVVTPGNEEWVLPQVLAEIGSHWPIAKHDGLYSFTHTIRTWNELLEAGGLGLAGGRLTRSGCSKLLSWLNTNPRGGLIGGKSQTKGAFVRYAAPVPVILSAFKQYRSVTYGSWNWTDPAARWLVDSDIMSWSNHFGVPVTWSADDLLQFRVGALEVKSGARQGTARKPESCAVVYGVQDKDFQALPRLMKLSLCQLWCFHPSIRTDLMITDHVNLDRHPEPLVPSEVFVPKTEDQQPQSIWDV